MNYKKLITKVYKSIGYSIDGHDYQIDTINKILNYFIDKGYNDIVLNAPTGSGKSVIGIVTSICIEIINNKLAFSDKSGSYTLIHVNTLVKQYEKDIKNLNSRELIMGASNYICKLHDSTADGCTISSDKKAGEEYPECSYENCEYLKKISDAFKAQHLVSNYAYYLSSNKLDKRLLSIFDESHMIDDAYNSINSLDITDKTLDLLFKGVSISETEMNELKTELYNSTEKNYIKLLTKLKDIINIYLHDIDNDIEEIFILEDYSQNNSKDISKKQKIKKRLENKLKIINKYLLENKFEFIVEKIKENKKFKVKEKLILKPIFIKDEIKSLTNKAEYRLFMSATNHPIIFRNVLGLNDFKFLQMKPIFNKETKKIKFLKIGKLNYKTLKSQETLDNINTNVKNIIDENKNTNGIIHIPSFKIGDIVYNYLNDNHPEINIIYQKKGEKLKDVIEDFYNSKIPTILMTPSGYEGLDLKDDLCRYIIVIKAPFQSLGDKRIKYISNNYKEVYFLNTIMKFIQGSGRGTRHKNDYSKIYCLDNTLKFIFNDNKNIWRNEFETI